MARLASGVTVVGPLGHFKVKQGVIPVALRGSHPVLIPRMPLLRADLDLLEEQNRIQKMMELTNWVHSGIVVATKPNGNMWGASNADVETNGLTREKT